jgi:hypothetical protein
MGWDAWSCDLLPTDSPGQHIQGDVIPLLTQGWDMLIAFPPCTYLCSSGMHWTTRGKRDPQLTEDALAFVRTLLNAPVPHIALENPVGAISTRVRKPDQIIQPHQFGHPESKTTCLWLKNLPPLTPTNILQKPASGKWDNQTASGQNKLGPSPTRWKERSKTYQGIAQAMASQWSAYASNSPTNAHPAHAAENLFAWSATSTIPSANAQVQATRKMTDGLSLKKADPCSQFVDIEPDPYILALALSQAR